MYGAVACLEVIVTEAFALTLRILRLIAALCDPCLPIRLFDYR